MSLEDQKPYGVYLMWISKPRSIVLYCIYTFI